MEINLNRYRPEIRNLIFRGMRDKTELEEQENEKVIQTGEYF